MSWDLKSWEIPQVAAPRAVLADQLPPDVALSPLRASPYDPARWWERLSDSEARRLADALNRA